jgi:putative redox protein
MPETHTTSVHHLIDKRFVGITPDEQRVLIDGEANARTGMRPMQLVLNALGACVGYDVVEILKKRRLDIHSYRIELVGDRSDEPPKRFTRIHARHVLDVPGLDPKNAERFIELTMTKYCSVSASLNADITFEVVLENESKST